MRKTLLLAAGMLALTAANAAAANKITYFHTSTDAGGGTMVADWVYATMRNVSPNGKYAVGTDFMGERYACYWSADEPEKMNILEGSCELYDVADDGTMVGSIKLNKGDLYKRPGIYKDGEWTMLDLDPDADIIGTTSATCITPDGKYIGGYFFTRDAAAEQGGRNYPVLWTRGDDGFYTCKCYDELALPDHQGFIVYDISDDGRILAGTVYAGASSQLCCLLVDGQLKMFNDVQGVLEPWYYKDKVMGYDTEYYIDGQHDTGDATNHIGGFLHMDSHNNAYGFRTVYTDIDPESHYGDRHDYATIYDFQNDTFVGDNSRYASYNFGFDPNHAFADKYYIVDGVAKTIEDAFGVKGDAPIGGIMGGSADGKVLFGSSLVFNEALQENEEVPFLLQLDEPLVTTGIKTVNQTGATVTAGPGTISVSGAKQVAVYSIGGALVSRSAETSVPSGVYIVRTDGQTQKVTVK